MRKFLLIFSLLTPLILKAQTYTDAQIKSAYIYNFMVNIEWPNESELSEFKICVYGNDTSVVPHLKTLSKTKEIRGLPIKIYSSNNFQEILNQNPQTIFVTKDVTPNMKSIYYKVVTSPILLVSDNASQLLYIMINFKISSDNKLTFELNSENIENQGLKTLPKLLVLGGTELDVRKLYKLKEQELKAEKQKVKEQEQRLLRQQSLIDSQLVEIDRQNNIIDKRKRAIDSLRMQIVNQQEVLNKQNKNLELLHFDIAKKQNLLNKKMLQLQSQQDSIEKQKSLIEAQKSQISEKLDKLDDLNIEIAQREEEIEKQKSELTNLHSTVENQRLYMWLMGIILLLVIFIIIYIFFNFKQKKRLNKKLIQKNNEVEAQSEELQQINIELTQQRDQIKHKNEFIKDSINYSQKIQSALLPSFKNLKKDFDSFLIYRPKDIVSGDFYWSYRIKTQNFDYKFIAVVDCTGHGVPGALLSIIGIRLLSEIISHKNIYNTAKILELLNISVKKVLKQDETDKITNDGMDVVLTRIEEKAKKYDVTFSGAKSALYYYSSEKDEIIRIKGSRKTIGGFYQNKNVKFENNYFTAVKNDILYLMSDGYIDQNNKERKRFGSVKLKKLLKKIKTEDVKKQKTILEQELDKWQGEEEQRDDITLLGVKMK